MGVNEELNEKYDQSRATGRELYRQCRDQGANDGLLSLAGLEVSAQALENSDAPQGVKVGAIAMFAHRVLEGKLPDRTHVEELCLICMKMQEIK